MRERGFLYIRGKFNDAEGNRMHVTFTNISNMFASIIEECKVCICNDETIFAVQY